LETRTTELERIKGYLLGQITEEDGSQVEARLLVDQEFYEELSIVEDELIDQYLSGKLSPADQQSFESYFVSSSERRQKVRFARALKKFVSVADAQSQEDGDTASSTVDSVEVKPDSPAATVTVFPSRKPIFSYAIAAVILIAVCGGGWAIKMYLDSSTGGRVLAIELIPAPATRDGTEVKQFVLTSDISSVQLQLRLPKNEYPSYEGALRDPSSRTILTSRNLKPQITDGVATVTMEAQADVLAPGDYRINLSGITPAGSPESIATFSFTIRR
jgi:hypothetical protein